MEGDLGDNSEKFIGLSFDEARTRVLTAFKTACSRNTTQDHGSSDSYLKRFLCCFTTRSPYSGIRSHYGRSRGIFSARVKVLVQLNAFAISLFIAAFAVSQHLAFRAGLIIPALILIICLTVNIWALSTYRDNTATELSKTLLNIVNNYESYVNVQSGQGLNLSESQCHIPSGHSQLSIVNTFRGGKWMKIPLLLLAEGDIIALMGGDIAPCKIYELLPMKRGNQTTANVQYNESLQQQWILGELLAAGTKILINKVNKPAKSTRPNLGEARRARSRTVDLNQHQHQHQQKTQTKPEKPSISPDSEEYAERQRYLGPESTEILRLAGDIRCFLLTETPIADFVQTIYERHDPNKNENTFIQQLMTRISLRVMVSMKWLPIMLYSAFIIRLATFSESRSQFPLTVFSAAGSMIVLLLPVTIPLMLITAEAMGTAEILSALEVALHRGEENKKTPASGNSRTHLSRANSAAALGSSPRQTVSSPMAVASEDNEFIDEDIDARAEDIADETDDKVEYRRFFTYILEVLRTRLFGLKVENNVLGPAARKANKGPPLLPIPLASLNMVDQLGAITMVCFVDDDVICENYSVTEEIFLLTEKHDDQDQENDSEHPVENKNANKGPRIKGTVLDLHANPEATGSRFENPMWWKFLPSLKPLGMDALLTYKHTMDKNVAPSFMAPTQSYLSSRSKSKSQRESKRTIIERSLVRHIQHTLPLEALRELSEEIGFNDEDLRIFTKALDVNVIASGLENAHLLEDNHQWGQEESRRRGSLLPQLRGGVYQDSRGGLQMMSLGDPTLILNYCREYWDGSTCSIAPLSAVDRQEVLNVYERWKLEDFDVVAFCYSPMPVSSLVYFQDSCTKEEGDNGRTLYFVDPTPVEKLTGKKAKKEVKIDENREESGLRVAESQVAETQLKTLEEGDEVMNALHHSVSTSNLDVILEEDAIKDAGLHASSEMIWDGDNNTEVSLSMRSLALKKSASDSNLGSNYPLDSEGSGLQLNWSMKSLNAADSELMTPTITKESLTAPNTLAKGYLDLDVDSSTMSDPPPTSRPLMKKAFTDFELLTSPKSEAGGEFVYNKLHNMQYIPLKQQEDRLNSRSVVFSPDDEPSPLGREDEVLPAPSEDVEFPVVRPLAKTVSLDRAMDSLPPSGSKRRNSFSAPGERTPEVAEVVTREKRSYSFSQSTTSHAPAELPSQDAVVADDQQQRKRQPGMKKERRHSSKAWATNNAAMRLLKQQRKLALRQIWGLLRQQIFLGMAASSVPVRRAVPNTKEDLDVAGIRFVYFSAQNMKRSKPVAEKLGIQFDWNCAISLRNLDAQESHDPHRHISSYADWDVMARMPHGIEAIKEHLLNVDNVPLLVSLFTDATSETIESMVEIFRENGEIVLTVGAGYRACNQHIYNAANLSTSVSYLPNVLPFIPAEEKDVFSLFPPLSSQCLTRSDLRLAFDLVGLGTVNILQLRSLDPALLLANLTRDVDVTQVQHLHLSVLLETIRKGRVLLLNKQQALAFFLISVISLSLWNIIAQFVPLSVSPTCPPPVALAFSLFYLPAICLAMLFNDGHENIMKNTPRKANLVLRPKDTSRFYNYLAGRVGVAVGGIFMCGYFAAASVHQGNESFFHSLARFHSIFEHNESFTLDFRKFCLVQDIMSHAALLTILGQSLTLLVRGQQPIKDFPWPSYYVEYYFTLLVVLLVHTVFMALRSALRNCDISGWNWLAGVDCSSDEVDKVTYGSLHGLVWGMMILSLVANMLVGFYVNHYDGHFYRRYLQFLRLEFDTRLGMHSPR